MDNEENVIAEIAEDTDKKIEMPELTVDLYTLNKNTYSADKALSPTKIREGFEKIQRAYTVAKESKYYMLLNNEKRYYTLFHKSDSSIEPFKDVVKECVESFGIIKDIVPAENDAFEIWITDEENETYCFMLFDYTAGVIEVEK